MSGYRSGSSIAQHRIRQILLPSTLVLLLYLLISVIALVFLNINALWRLLLGQPISSGDIAPLTEEFSTFQDRLSIHIVMLFWLFIGAITYTAIWLLENVVFIAKTEVENSRYVTRNPAAKSRYWQSALASNLFLLLMALLWASFIALYLRLLLPALSDFFSRALFSDPVQERFLYIAAAVLGNAAAIYVFLLMSRFITMSWRASRP